MNRQFDPTGSSFISTNIDDAIKEAATKGPAGITPVIYVKTGLITGVGVMETHSNFTSPSGKYYGSGSNLSLLGFRWNIAISSAGAAGDLKVDVRYENVNSGVQHVVGGGQRIYEQTIISTSVPVASSFNECGEILITPVPLVQNKVYFVDISGIDFWVLNDFEIELLIG